MIRGERLPSTRNQRFAPSTRALRHHPLPPLPPAYHGLLLILVSHPHPGMSSWLPGSTDDSIPGETSIFQHHCLSHHATGNKCDWGHHASCRSAAPKGRPPSSFGSSLKVSQSTCKPPQTAAGERGAEAARGGSGDAFASKPRL